MGLECTEHTEYDAIFIMNDPKCTLKAFDFLRIIRNIGIATPLILLHDQDFRPEISAEPGLPASGFNTVLNSSTLSQYTLSLKFSNTLKKPFTCRDICLLIDQIFYFHFMSTTTTPGSIASMPVSSNLNSQPSSEKRQCKVSRHCGKNESEIHGSAGNAFTTVPIFPSCAPPFNTMRNSDIIPNSNGTQPVASQEQVAFFDYYQQPILSFSHSGSFTHQHWSTAGNTGTMHGITMSGLSAGVAVTGTATAFTNGGVTGLEAGALNTHPTNTTASAMNAVMDFEVGDELAHETIEMDKNSNSLSMHDAKGGLTSSEDSDSCMELKSGRRNDKVGNGSQAMLRYPHHSLLSLMNVTEVQYV
jgi:hypothetical protein